MTIKLPQKPEPEGLGWDFDKGWDGVEAYGHTEAAMDAYGKACALAALEEAEEACDDHWYSASSMQDAIRALRTELENTK